MSKIVFDKVTPPYPVHTGAFYREVPSSWAVGAVSRSLHSRAVTALLGFNPEDVELFRLILITQRGRYKMLALGRDRWEVTHIPNAIKEWPTILVMYPDCAVDLRVGSIHGLPPHGFTQTMSFLGFIPSSIGMPPLDRRLQWLLDLVSLVLIQGRDPYTAFCASETRKPSVWWGFICEEVLTNWERLQFDQPWEHLDIARRAAEFAGLKELALPEW